MTNADSNERQAELQREALALVRRLVSGDATIADVEDARRWKQLSVDHAEAFVFASRLWERLGPAGHTLLERRGEVLPSGRALVRSPVMSRRALVGGATALAASAAYMAVRPPYGLWPSLAELSADHRTATGERKRVDLADGASIDLNTQTSIVLSPGVTEGARIELVVGEAVIDTGPRLPEALTVIAGDGRVSSRQARFNVRYDGGTSCGVSCLEGEVTVEHSGAVATLGPGRRLTYSDLGLGLPESVDPEIAAAWHNGLLIFRQTPLSEVVAEINRYRPGRIVLINAALGRRLVNARFRVDTVDEIMVLAQRVFGATVRSVPGGIVLLS